MPSQSGALANATSDVGAASPQLPLWVVFVCWGNICRSPMAEQVARAWAERAGLDESVVVFDSAGVSDEEQGHRIDPRAARVLTAHGYDPGTHRAREIAAADIETADLVIAAEPRHVAMMRHLVPDATNLALISDFNPAAAPGQGLPDPWWGAADGFESTLAAIEDAMPGLLAHLRAMAFPPATGG